MYFGSAKDWNTAIAVVVSVLLGVGMLIGIGIGYFIWGI